MLAGCGFAASIPSACGPWGRLIVSRAASMGDFPAPWLRWGPTTMPAMTVRTLFAPLVASAWTSGMSTAPPSRCGPMPIEPPTRLAISPNLGPVHPPLLPLLVVRLLPPEPGGQPAGAAFFDDQAQLAGLWLAQTRGRSAFLVEECREVLGQHLQSR